MIWEKTEVDASMVRMISQRYSIDALWSSILVRRNITEPQSINFFLEDDIRFLYNPFLFKDMEDVVDRILYARDEEEKVLIFGDKDVDGVTSLVILYEALKSMNIDTSWRVPLGFDGYGLSLESVEEAAKNDITLIITVDCGISAFDSIGRARELGIDVIILDHHNPREEEVPGANYIINPKVLGCEYPFKNLAACGVVSKVLWALGFSSIDSLYKSDFCFLNLEKVGDEVNIQCLKVHNLLEKERLEISINPDNWDSKTLVDFLKGEAILVYNQEKIKPLIASLFGSRVEIGYIDIKKDIERILPWSKGMDLPMLTEKSRVKKYANPEFSNIDTLLNLFITYVSIRYADKFELFTQSLDLVALGTVADLMPLRGENRIFVRKGLKVLEKTQREGLRALLFNLNLLGKDLTSKDLSWGISPIINSAGRLDKANIAVEFLLSRDSNTSNRLMLNMQSLNKERRELSQKLWDTTFNLLYKSLEDFSGKLAMVYHKDMIKGVTGLIASKALSTLDVPIIVLAKEKEFIIGSIRSKGDLDINLLFESFSDMLLDFGGHSCAAGFRLKSLDLERFNKRLTKLIGQKKLFIPNYNKQEKHIIDATIPSNYLSPEIIKLYDGFEPFGEGNPPIKLVTKGVKILDIEFLGKMEKKHLKILLEIGNIKWPGVFWNGASRVGVEFTKGDIVNIAYKVERNNFTGGGLQLNIVDIIK